MFAESGFCRTGWGVRTLRTCPQKICVFIKSFPAIGSLPQAYQSIINPPIRPNPTTQKNQLKRFKKYRDKAQF